MPERPLPDLSAERDPPLQPAPDPARGRPRGAAEAEGGARAVHRRRRPRLAGRDVPGGRRRRHARHRRLRRRRFQQPAAADPARDARTSGARRSSRQRERLQAINPDVRVEAYADGADQSANALDLFARYDVVVDGTDNFPTRYLVNDACVLTGKPVRLRQHLPVRGPGVGVRGAGRPLLSLPLPGAAAARPGAELRRGRRARRASRASSGRSRRPRRSS